MVLKNIRKFLTQTSALCEFHYHVPVSSTFFFLPHSRHSTCLPCLACTASHLASTEKGNPQSARPQQLPWSEATTSTTDPAWPLRCPTEEGRPSGRRLWVHCSLLRTPYERFAITQTLHRKRCTNYCVLKRLVYWNLQVILKDVQCIGHRGLRYNGHGCSRHDADVRTKLRCGERRVNERPRVCNYSTTCAQVKQFCDCCNTHSVWQCFSGYSKSRVHIT